ncbi:MAG: hypothetical protein K8Q97_02280 [Candidatus Andersenbacteria bacterium]|nr:hypothetical protein [Candidatus Andersenbacteria bacterium]
MRFDISRFIPKGSVILWITTLGSYVLGLLRDRVLAHAFGASSQLDSYYAAFLVPDFIFNVLVASGIAAAAVPLFTQLYKKSHAHAYEYMNSLLSAAVGTMIAVAIILFVFAPQLSSLVAPGLGAHAHVLVAQMMRVLAVSSILFAASNAFGAMLVAQKKFLFYGVSPMLYNLGIVGGALVLAPRFGIMGVAYGTVFGAFLHMIVRCADAVRGGWKFKAAPTWWHTEEMKQTLRLMVPKMVGHPVDLVTFWLFTTLASLLSVGSITALNFARNFQSVPVSMIGIAMSTAVFPALAEARLKSAQDLRALLNRTAWVILLLSCVAALVMYSVRYQIIALLLGGGSFGGDAVARTALTLGMFCLSIPTESLSHLFARAFYSTQNTITPVIFSVIGLGIAGTSAYMLMGKIGIVALPLGFFLGSFVKTAGLWLLFLRKAAD